MTDVKFITRSGLKSAKKAARHEIEGFLESVYFKEEVLKKYESNKDFKIGDHGTVLFGYKWGLFRGVYRVAKGYISANLGDLGEGLPDKELAHWKQYNVPPSKIPIEEGYFDFRDTIRQMVHFMNKSNERVENHIRKFYFDVELKDVRLFDLTGIESTLDHLKKVINKKTTVDEFQARIIFLNILVLESINTELIKKIFNVINKDLCYSYERLALKEIYEKYLIMSTPKKLKSQLKGAIEPLKSLRLLQKFLLLLKVHHDVITSLNINNLSDLKKKKKQIYSKISSEFINFYNFRIYGIEFQNKEYFLHNEKAIEEDTAILRLLNRFRNASAAHGFNDKEYKEILKKLWFKKKTKDFSHIYEQLISRVSYDIEHIYFNLISLDPPIIDYYRKYLDETLKELERQSKSYQSTFEGLSSFISDFPELFNDSIKGIEKIYSKKQNDKEFIIELGCFIESVSYSVKEKSNTLVDYILKGYEYNKTLSVTHLSHLIKNSEKISDEFFNTVYKFVLEALKDKDPNVDFCAQHVIYCLIEKFPNKLNKSQLSDIFKGRKIHYDLIKKYIEGK
jgi:hypothetical protein